VRVGLDATWAAAEGTGTASYTRGLIRALAGHANHEFVLYFRPGDEERNPLFQLDRANVTKRCVGGWGQIGRTWLSLSRETRRDRLDIFHSPSYFLPVCKAPRVATFHDVNMFLQWNKWWRPGMRAGWASLAIQTVAASRLANRIVADSHHAATQIRRVLHLRDSEVDVVYPGVNDLYFEESRDATAVDRYALHEYFLSVGVLSPQKNLEGLVRAFAALDRPKTHLVIVGRRDGPYFDQTVGPLIDELHVTSRVRVLGVVPDLILRRLYRSALALVFPSFAEGFGLPPLEAMACGTPVVAACAGSLPEVVADAGLLIDPNDIRDLAEAMSAVADDKSLAGTLSERGRMRARLFRWSTSARRMFDVYESFA